jgi:hypothetical protein
MRPLKIATIGLGAVIGVAHIGILGHLISRKPTIQPPAINFPSGRYSSYKVEVGKDGYTIEYKANDPKTLTSERSIDLVENKKGLFGGREIDKTEYRRDEYTAEGVRNTGGGVGEGKSADDIECIVADAGARSQGAMAGTAISTGVIAPAVMNIPYVGWLAAGWANLLGQRVGAEAGSKVGSVFNDC